MAHPGLAAGDTIQETLRPERTELALVTCIVLIGLMLRIAHPSRISVEHFDEGVYASNLWFTAGEGGAYPYRHLYAPPLWPAVVEWSMVGLTLVCGSPNPGTLVGLLFGTMTIGLIWWVARRWFGREAALAAAILSALNDFQIVYSRTVLTDTLLCFWMLLAVYLIWEAYQNLKLHWMLAAGLATALAWWTKYNGWLPLAIGLAALVPWLVLNKPPQRPVSRYLLCWICIALTALVLWSPVWNGLQSTGGYAAVAENHRGYLVGLSGWISSFTQQLDNHRHFDGWLSYTGLWLATMTAGMWSCARFTWNATAVLPVGISIALLAVAVGISSSAGLGIATVVGIAFSLWPKRTQQKPGHFDHNKVDPHRMLACWLVAAWFCSLLVATPFYRPYPRLTLPWLMSAWLGTAAAIGWLSRWQLQGSESRAVRPGNRGASAVLFLISGCVLIWSLGRVASKGVPGWQDRTGLESIAGQVIGDARGSSTQQQRQPDQMVIYVYAEPALIYHLSVGRILARPVGDLKFVRPNALRPTISTFLVTGPHAHRSKTFSKQWNQNRNQFRLIGSYPYRPSDLVLVNGRHPKELTDPSHRPEQQIRLYSVHVAGN